MTDTDNDGDILDDDIVVVFEKRMQAVTVADSI